MSYFDFFHADRHINNKKQTENLFMLDTITPKACKKMSKTRNEKNQIFQKLYQWALISFGF